MTLASAFAAERKVASRVSDLRFVGAGRSRQTPGQPVSVHHDDALAAVLSAPGRRR